jgi:hypothetical protein
MLGYNHRHSPRTFFISHLTQYHFRLDKRLGVFDMCLSAVKDAQAELSFPGFPSVSGYVQQRECRKRNYYTGSRPLKSR